MSNPLTAANGAVLIGVRDVSVNAITGAIAPATVANGATVRSSPALVPRPARRVSFEIVATPSGACALAIVIRTANHTSGDGDVLSSGGNVSSTTVFDSFSSATSGVITIDAEANYVQIEITPSGSDCQLTVVGAAR